MRLRSAAGLILMLGASVAGATAQDLPIRTGDRIRIAVRDPGGRFAGTAGVVRGDSLWFTPDRGAEVVIPFQNVTRWWVSRGTRSDAAREAMIGAVAFGGLALALGAMANLAGCHWDGAKRVCPRGWDNVLAWVLVFGGSGAVGGAIRGSRRRVERWEEIPPPSIRLSPVVATSRVGLALVVAF